MITKLLIVAGIGVVILLAVIATRPDRFSLSRSIVIAAPPAAVFPLVNDFHNWDAWSPWADLDPEATAVFEGAGAGQGAVFKWSGNNKIGEGRQEIVESRELELVRIKLEFIRPFAATNETEFRFEPEGTGTRVTWMMSGRNNFLAKAFSLVMDCEKMVGPQFEKGLANIKQIVERPAS